MSARVLSDSSHGDTGTSADWLVMLALTGLWVALVLVVDPRGDFPLVDDWSYGRSVKTLVEQHRLEFDGWNNPTLFLQVLYGALFCLPFGFSFEALRISTLFAGLAGGLGTYALLRQGAASRSVAAFGSLVLMLNPVYFQYSFTFMTDVPFAALAIVSGVFFLRALRTGNVCDVALGTTMACAATLVRQIGIAIPIAYGLTLLAVEGFRRRTLLLAGLPVIVSCGVLIVYNGIIDYLHLTPALSGAVQKLILSRFAIYGPLGLLKEAVKVGISLFTFGACFILPFLLLPVGRKALWRNLSWRAKAVSAFAGAGCFALILLWSLPNTFAVFTIVPVGLLNAHGWGAIEVPAIFQQTFSVVAIAAAAWVISIIVAIGVRQLSRTWSGTRNDAAAVLFGIATPAIMLAPLLFSDFMDRYLIPAMPFVLLALVAAWKAWGRPVVAPRQAGEYAGAIALFLVYGVLAVVYTHDSLIWNRARWDAVNYLIRERGISPVQIDGGFTVNGWYLFAAEGPVREQFIHWQSATEGVWWSNKAADYVICFVPCDKSQPTTSQVVWTRPYTGWLPGADGAIVIRHYLQSGVARGVWGPEPLTGWRS